MIKKDLPMYKHFANTALFVELTTLGAVVVFLVSSVSGISTGLTV